jgi:hypothetical protein
VGSKPLINLVFGSSHRIFNSIEDYPSLHLLSSLVGICQILSTEWLRVLLTSQWHLKNSANWSPPPKYFNMILLSMKESNKADIGPKMYGLEIEYSS